MATCMPWFKVHAGWSSHPKVGRLCDVLANDLADAYVGRLWDYCAERQGDGRFAAPGATGAVERAVRWTGARGALADALVSVGLLEREEDGSLVVHDWADEQRAVADKFERDRVRRRLEREGRTEVARLAHDSLSTLNSQISTSQPSSVTTHGAETHESRDHREASERPSQPDTTTQPAMPQAPMPEALQALWNRLAPPKGLAKWGRMSDARKGAARAALLAVPDLGKWEAWLAHELARPWNLGQNGSGWKADVDWLLRVKTRDAVADFDPATAAKPAPTGDRPRLGPPTAPQRVSGDRPRI